MSDTWPPAWKPQLPPPVLTKTGLLQLRSWLRTSITPLPKLAPNIRPTFTLAGRMMMPSALDSSRSGIRVSEIACKFAQHGQRLVERRFLARRSRGGRGEQAGRKQRAQDHRKQLHGVIPVQCPSGQTARRLTGSGQRGRWVGVSVVRRCAYRPHCGRNDAPFFPRGHPASLDHCALRAPTGTSGKRRSWARGSPSRSGMTIRPRPNRRSMPSSPKCIASMR